MAKAFDIIQDESMDLMIQNGDFVVGESDQQHINDIIYSTSGWWKEFPQLGVDIVSYLSGSDVDQELSMNIQLQLKSDGYSVNTLNVNSTNENLELDLDAERN